MAERIVFVPNEIGSVLVQEVPVNFKWSAGLSASQKKKNVAALHSAAEGVGLTPLLEISTKSELEVGQRLSAFNLKMAIDARKTTVECVYQGSKVFELGGPYDDLYWVTSREAKKDARLKESGRLVGFRFNKKEYPTSPPTAFYDWLYFSALYPHRDWISEREDWAGYTDIEYNPERSFSCQARSFAAFISLHRRGLLADAMASFDRFREVMQSKSI